MKHPDFTDSETGIIFTFDISEIRMGLTVDGVFDSVKYWTVMGYQLTHFFIHFSCLFISINMKLHKKAVLPPRGHLAMLGNITTRESQLGSGCGCSG